MMPSYWKLSVKGDDFQMIERVASEAECWAMVKELGGREVFVELPSGEKRVVGVISSVKFERIF